MIFNGGYGYDYVKFAADQVTKQTDFTGVTIKVSPSTQIAQQLQPRFVGGNPPDLIDNSGENAIGFSTIEQQLETLDDVFEANNYEGTKISDTLYPNVKLPGTFDGKFVAMNYVMTVYGIWYSATLFQQNGWTPPKTWDEAMALGAKAKAKGKYLLVWGKEAATYYQTMAVNSAIKEGGDEVRLALENLEPKCWSQPQLQGVFTALGEMVQKGYFVPGGAGTQFTAAQAKWSNDEQAILYPSGGWIENEMKDATKSDFQMTGAPGADRHLQPEDAVRGAPCRCGRAVHRAVPGRRTSPAARRSCARCCRRRPRPTSPRPVSRRRSSRAWCRPTGSGRPRWSRRRRCWTPPAATSSTTSSSTTTA